jgi:AcrR family transcriptional regulator
VRGRGYENTTVEQIAEAAETSTTTFYRYFPVKEDVMLANDASPLFEAVIAGRPDGEPLAATVRAAMAAVVAAAEADRDLTLARMRLIAAVPALEARVAGRERATIGVLAGLLARRAGRPADDYQVELVAFALAGVVFTASRRWVAAGGATPLAALVDQALTTVGPLLDALGPAGPLLLFRQGNSPVRRWCRKLAAGARARRPHWEGMRGRRRWMPSSGMTGIASRSSCSAATRTGCWWSR